MLNKIRNFVLSLALLAMAPFAVAGGLTVAQVVDMQGVIQARLSPNGKYVASIEARGKNRGVVLTEIDTGVVKLLRNGFMLEIGQAKVPRVPHDVRWITNDLIALDWGYEVEAIDLSGKTTTHLGAQYVGKADGDPESPWVLVYTDRYGRSFAAVNARTAMMRKFELPVRGELLAWAIDAKGELRAATIRDSSFWSSKTSVTNWYKWAGKTEWEKLAEFKVTDNYWVPFDVPEQDGKLEIVSSQGRDTSALFSYDVKTRARGELLAGHPTLDIAALSGTAADGFTSVVTQGLKPERIWLDERWRAAQLSVDAALPGRINKLSGNVAKRLMVFSYSDVDPASFYLVDMERSSMGLFGRFREAIKAEDMQPMEAMTYAARDGLAIPAYLTRPAGKQGPQPMVVLIHGGPTVRDAWEWDPEVQLLAARGYVVFQPQFRGSAGFGRRFMEAGFGQWGLIMQDDVTDGVQHMVRKGVADPARICIYGASYGGYAALWGLVKTPELYRCGVSFAGVSDIEAMFSDGSDVNDSKVGRELQRFLVGDLRISSEQFNAVSPLKHAARIRAPVLLMHGEEDVRVPISHSEKMAQALGVAGKDFEWEAFPDLGHSRGAGEVYQKYYERLFAFLDKHIGPAGKAGAAAAGQAAGK